MKRSALSVALVGLGLIVLGGLGTAQALEITTFDLVPRNAGLPARCDRARDGVP